jgi:alpha-2-macroglobulin
MKKRLPFVLAGSVLVALVLVAYFGARARVAATVRPPRLSPQDPAWASFVAAHTTGLVSRKSDVRVRFVDDIVPEGDVGSSAESIVSFDPPIEGSLTFASRREIVLVPTADLKRGRYYRVSVRPRGGRLAGIPSSLEPFEFVFQVIEQELEVEISGLSASEEDDTAMVLKGLVATADTADADGIESMLRATYLGAPVPLSWQHDAEGKRHEFASAGLARQAVAQSVRLEWNGNGIGADSEGTREVEVPARDEFKVTRVQTFQNEQAYVQLYFSDVLDPGQNLNGLVYLDRGGHTARIDGNVLTLYPETVSGNLLVTVEPGIRDATGRKLLERSQHPVAFSSQKPQVRFVGNGVILPESPVLSVPFEVVGARSVQVTAFRVFESNVGQFLQANKLDGASELGRVGRYLWRRTVHLSSPSPGQWNRFKLDVTDLFRDEPGGLYRLTLSLGRSDSTYTCPGDSASDSHVEVGVEAEPASDEDLLSDEASSWDYAQDYYDPDGSRWVDRNDPCKDAYYQFTPEVTTSRNFVASNIGLLAKRDQRGRLLVVATDLRTSLPLPGVQISVRNFQDQVLGTAVSDGSGFAAVESEKKPFYLLARRGRERGYLKLSDGTALPVSHFDVGGEKVTSGLKGHIYGERGVYRPGDALHLTFVLDDDDDSIPARHPVTMELLNPGGQLIDSKTNGAPVGEFYAFEMKTAEDAPTGTWTARARLGGNVFVKPVKIETVMPNRLKLELDFGKEKLGRADLPLRGEVFSQWLSGAKASGLDAKVEVRLDPVPTRFDRSAEFTFDDPTREFHGDSEVLFEGELDAEGKATFRSPLSLEETAPGMLRASFTSRVFESGGLFSVSYESLPFSPFERFVGIKLPKGDATRDMLLTDVDHTVEIATLSADGAPVAVPNVDVAIYKIEWKWWWDQSGESLARYSAATSTSAVASGTVKTENGQGRWQFRVAYPAWGRYLLRACDREGGHCAARTFYIDWPGWAGRAQEQAGPGANALTFLSDKKSYQVGEVAKIRLPQASQGRALLAIENGTGILEHRWLELQGEEPVIEIPVTKGMSPNVYVSVTLVQPHEGKDNDRPIRLYGVIPLLVDDPATRLEPRLAAPDEWRPNSTASVSVSEASGRPMTYTVAVVDEGLLGLTSFKTPDLHREFFRKEALGVATWDLFDDVVGSYGGELERLLSLGGSSDLDVRDDGRERRRFPPVVTFLGPFELAAGATARHEFPIPEYVGAVRVMVVAGSRGAYGSTDKSVYVRTPLMLLATLPRVVGPLEEIAVPLSLFVMDDSIRDVTVRMQTDALLDAPGERTAKASFTGSGEKMVFLKLRARERLGTSTVRFSASSGSHRADSEIHLEVRSPNPPTLRAVRKLLEPGETWQTELTPHGLPGTNRVTLEVAATPPLDLERRLDYLVRYPHGCLEQTTSAVFPQLYLAKLVRLDPEREKEVEGNVRAGIEKLRGFQVPAGAFLYWPGGFWVNAPDDPRNQWATTYAGHFLVEASQLGYSVPAPMMSDWVKFQKAAAQSWSPSGGPGGSALLQTYRLYTLALAGQPELGAMNRLRERSDLTSVERWQLAAAYRLAGLGSAAEDLVRGDRGTVAESLPTDATFGSTLRDRALVLSAMVTLDRKENDGLRDLVELVSRDLASDDWQSTQAVAQALLAMAHFAGKTDLGTPAFEHQVGSGPKRTVTMATPVSSTILEDFPEGGSPVVLRNTSGRRLFASLLVRGVSKAGTEDEASSGLRLDVTFTDSEGDAVEVEDLDQGEDFVAHVSVSNTTGARLDNLALSQIFPSGWEILATRLDPTNATTSSGLDYEDVRDDRVYRYFGLAKGETKSFATRLNAAYLGKYYLPSVSVEAMYDASKTARTRGAWVEVTEAQAQSQADGR